jgi:hypothetical protein
MKADLLEDLRRAVDRGIAEGTDINDFREDFWAIVEKHGWHGWTGDESEARREWRIQTIFETNLNASYAAGRYAQLTDPDLLAVMPYWRYVHAEDVMTPRPQAGTNPTPEADYAPGKSITEEMRKIVAEKAGKYPEQLAEDFLAEMEKGGITPAKPAAPDAL